MLQRRTVAAPAYPQKKGRPEGRPRREEGRETGGPLAAGLLSNLLDDFAMQGEVEPVEGELDLQEDAELHGVDPELIRKLEEFKRTMFDPSRRGGEG